MYPTCSKNRIFETKILLVFISFCSKWLPQCPVPRAPSNLRCPLQCDRDYLVGCASGEQGHGPMRSSYKQPGLWSEALHCRNSPGGFQCPPGTKWVPFSILDSLPALEMFGWQGRDVHSFLPASGEALSHGDPGRPAVTLPNSPLQAGCAHPPQGQANSIPQAKICAIWQRWGERPPSATVSESLVFLTGAFRFLVSANTVLS